MVKPLHLMDYYFTNSTDFPLNFTDFPLSPTGSFNSIALCYFNEPDENTSCKIEDRYNILKDLISSSHLNEEEKEHVEAILQKNNDCFFLSGDKLKFSNLANHSIPTTDNIPIHVKQYRYPSIYRKEIEKQIDKLLGNDIIKPSTSPYNAPLWIVPKKAIKEGEKR